MTIGVVAMSRRNARPLSAQRCTLRWVAFIAGCVFAGLSQAATPTETRYTVLMAGKPAGVQTSAVKATGERELMFEYNDRGRGPKLTSRMRLDTNGLPVSIDTTGNDYLKVPVTESFKVADNVARWKSEAESGEKQLTGRAYYLSMQSVPEDVALLANALLKAPGNRLTLLPDGEASLKRTSELTLKDRQRTRRVSSYEITGLGFTPTTVWLDQDNSFFASVSSWLSVVRSGWESSTAELLAKQDALEMQRTRDIAHSLTRKPTAPVAITNANLFDADTGKSTPDTTVVIEGNHIKSVGPSATAAIPANAQKIDARGRALLPGLWDMHVHIGPDEGVQHMAAGVTSVRDLANDHDTLQAIKKRIESGEEIGPRIITTGFMDGRGPYAGPTKMFVDTQAEAQTAIDFYAKNGYEGIKIYSSIKPELVPTIIKLAHAKGLRVSGHVPAFMNAQQFIEAGADEMQHINFVFLNFFFDDVKDTRTPVRFNAVADRAATLDLSSPQVRSFVKLLQDRKTVIDPTVTIFESMFTDRPGKVSVSYAPVADRLPPQVRRGLLAGGLPVPEGKDQRFHDSAQALLRMIKLLYDSGVTIVPGTDAMAGFTLHRELELYVDAGIPAPEVLRIATVGSARVMKRERELGSIAPGKLADLILVDGDPARRIGDIRRTALVIKDGQIFDPAALYRSIGVAPTSGNRAEE
jgi:hypothetical protein